MKEKPQPAGLVFTGLKRQLRYLNPAGLDEISLDHDLGDDERGTGYDVVLWI